MGNEPAGGGQDLRRIQSALASPFPADRLAVLGAVEPGVGVAEVVMAALDDPDADVRRACVQALGKVDGPTGIRGLLRAAGGDLSAGVRAEAVSVLGRLLAVRHEV
jgi:HEAT repeat protein